MVVVADGTDEAAARLQRVLTTDPGTGVMRHADAGYERAIEVARERGVRLPMLDRARPDERGAVPTSAARSTSAGRAARRPAPDPRSPVRPARARRRCCCAPRTRCAPRAGSRVYLDLMGAASSPDRFVPRRARRRCRRPRSARAPPEVAPHPPARAAGGKQHAADGGATRCSRSGPPSTRPAAARSRCSSTRRPRSARSPTSRACARWTARSSRRSRARPRGTVLATSYPTARAPPLARAGDARRWRRSRRATLAAGLVRAGSSGDADACVRGRPSAGRATCASCSTPSARGATSATPGPRRWRAAAGSSGCAGTPTRRCSCAAAATACRRRCWRAVAPRRRG